MTKIKQKLSGVFAPVVTPFERDELLLDCLRDNLKKLSKTDLTGYFALGSNGEFRSLSEREELQVLEVFSKEKSEKVVIVGTSCESSHQTILFESIEIYPGHSVSPALRPLWTLRYSMVASHATPSVLYRTLKKKRFAV